MNFEHAENEKYFVSMAMIKYGGGFFEHLGRALVKADLGNQAKIKLAFRQDWDRYLEIGKNDKSINHEIGD